jgi:hypothetical protein
MNEPTNHGGDTNSRVELNIFTNSTTYNSPSTDMIEKAYDSFSSQFGPVEKVTVWLDPSPNVGAATQYKQNLKEKFNNVRITSSLSDGYIRSIQESQSEFMFMLEHDWTFLEIDHNFEQICNQMNEIGLTHLRFNKRYNLPVIIEKDGLIQVNGSYFSFCMTHFVSNNPHIIHRERYLKTAFKYLEKKKGSLGIEEKLKNKQVMAAIYGPVKFPNKIQHMDGRNIKPTVCYVCGTTIPKTQVICNSKKCNELSRSEKQPTETKSKENKPKENKPSREELLAKQRHLILQQKKMDRELRQLQKQLSQS